MPKKYELTDEIVRRDDKTLYRIRALRNIDRYGVKKGDVGGFIESERNLSQIGDAWVSDKAWVFDDGRVTCDAWVSDYALIFGNAQVANEAHVAGNSVIYNDSCIWDNAYVADVLINFPVAIQQNAKICSYTDLLYEKVIGPNRTSLVAYTTDTNEIYVIYGDIAAPFYEFCATLLSKYDNNPQVQNKAHTVIQRIEQYFHLVTPSDISIKWFALTPSRRDYILKTKGIVTWAKELNENAQLQGKPSYSDYLACIKAATNADKVVNAQYRTYHIKPENVSVIVCSRHNFLTGQTQSYVTGSYSGSPDSNKDILYRYNLVEDNPKESE